MQGTISCNASKRYTDGRCWWRDDFPCEAKLEHKHGFVLYVNDKDDVTGVMWPTSRPCWLCRAGEPHSELLHDRSLFEDDEVMLAKYGMTDIRYQER